MQYWPVSLTAILQLPHILKMNKIYNSASLHLLFAILRPDFTSQLELRLTS